MKKLLTSTIASASIAIGAIPALAEVDPKIHKLCIEAKDYSGCIKSMIGADSCVYNTPESAEFWLNAGSLGTTCMLWEKGLVGEDTANRTMGDVYTNDRISRKDKKYLWEEIEQNGSFPKCAKLMKKLGIK